MKETILRTYMGHSSTSDDDPARALTVHDDLPEAVGHRRSYWPSDIQFFRLVPIEFDEVMAAGQRADKLHRIAVLKKTDEDIEKLRRLREDRTS